MTIDEAIDREKFEAEKWTNGFALYINKENEEIEYHKQLVEWLEDYKKLKAMQETFK